MLSESYIPHLVNAFSSSKARDIYPILFIQVINGKIYHIRYIKLDVTSYLSFYDHSIYSLFIFIC